MGTQEGPLQVDALDSVPVCLGVFQKLLFRRDAGAVNEDIDSAKAIQGDLDHASDIVGPADVQCVDPNGAGGFTHFGPKRLKSRSISIASEHLGPCAGQTPDGRSSDPSLTRSNYHRHSFAELHVFISFL